MDLFWIYDLSNCVMGVLIVGTFVGCSLLGLAAVRRWFAASDETEHDPRNEILGHYLAAIGAIYGITVGLLAAGTWSTYSDVEDSIIGEAASLAALYRDVSSLPMPHRGQLQQALKDHAISEIEKEWPAHQQGKILPSPTLNAFQAVLAQVQPANETDKILFAETFRQFNNYVELRRERLGHVTSGLPATLWVVVLLGATLTIGVTWFFQVPSFSLHAAMTATLSGLVGLVIFVIAAMDWPYRGAFSVSPEAIQSAMAQYMTGALTPPRQGRAE